MSPEYRMRPVAGWRAAPIPQKPVRTLAAWVDSSSWVPYALQIALLWVRRLFGRLPR